MTHKARNMVICCAVLAAVVVAPPTWAEKTVNDKGRVVYHNVKVEVMDADDVPGHILGIAHQRGLQTNAAGEVATWSTKVFIDFKNGSGPHQAYTIITFEDKSTMITQAKGVTGAHADGTASFSGTFDYIGGSGRFAGIKGGGTYAGRRLAPISPGVSADIYQDWEASYTLPSD